MSLEKLKEIREQNEMTMERVAEKVGITKSYYSMIESGKRGLSYPMAVRIALVFSKQPDEIFLESELTNSELNK